MRYALLLGVASPVLGKVFSPNEDLLAFPQYQIVFSDSYILDTDAESSLALASSYSVAKAESTDSSTASQASAVATRSKHDSAASPPQQTYEYMVLDSAPYLCSIPIATEQKNETETTQSKEEESKELARATDRGSELLKGLEQCLYFTSGWWSYSFCQNRAVEQYHALPPGKGSSTGTPQKDNTVPSFILGRFPDGRQQTESSLATAQTRGDMRYMSQKLHGGSICDITGRPRKVEVQFHCFPGATDRIGLIKEVSTCSYLMVIYTSRLCGDMAFEMSRQHSQTSAVECQAILRESEVEKWRTARQTRDRLDSTSEKKSSPRPIVGNIELGGQVLVGGEGRRIEAPRTFAPEESAGEIVVRWHPDENEGKIQRLSENQLDSLDLDPAVVSEMAEALKDLAGKSPWSLRVVEKANGVRELRGIVESDEEYVEDGLDAAGEEDTQQQQQQQQPEQEDGQQGSEETYKDVPRDEL